MTRSALLLCAGVLAVACFACIPATAPTPQPIGPGFAAFCQPGDPDSFANAVQMVVPFPPSTRATPVPNGPVAANIRNDLKAAFTLAPPFFRAQLCALDGVFVDPNQNGMSWGLRNYDTGKRYIAVTADLWAGGGSAPRFRTFENGVLKRLLKQWTGPQHPSGPPDPSESARTVLAALAHEFGHVLFYDTFVPVRGGGANFDPSYDNFCNDGQGNFFTGAAGTWSPNITDEPPVNRWRGYGDVASLHRSDDVQTVDILNAVPPPGQPDTKGAGLKLSRIYRLEGTPTFVGRWASFFATFSPQEDFVETFKLFVLRKAASPLQSLPINIPIAGGPPISRDIPGTCPSRPALMRKLSCFAHALCGDPTADPCGTTCLPKL